MLCGIGKKSSFENTMEEQANDDGMFENAVLWIHCGSDPWAQGRIGPCTCVHFCPEAYEPKGPEDPGHGAKWPVVEHLCQVGLERQVARFGFVLVRGLHDWLISAPGHGLGRGILRIVGLPRIP